MLCAPRLVRTSKAAQKYPTCYFLIYTGCRCFSNISPSTTSDSEHQKVVDSETPRAESLLRQELFIRAISKERGRTEFSERLTKRRDSLFTFHCGTINPHEFVNFLSLKGLSSLLKFSGRTPSAVASSTISLTLSMINSIPVSEQVEIFDQCFRHLSQKSPNPYLASVDRLDRHFQGRLESLDTQALAVIAQTGLVAGYTDLAFKALFRTVLLGQAASAMSLISNMAESIHSLTHPTHPIAALLSRMYSTAFVAHCCAGRHKETADIVSRMMRSDIFIPNAIWRLHERASSLQTTAFDPSAITDETYHILLSLINPKQDSNFSTTKRSLLPEQADTFPLDPNQLLFDLVSAREFTAADNLRALLSYSDVDIQPNNRYSWVVRDISKSHSESPWIRLEEGVVALADWVALVPPSDLALHSALGEYSHRLHPEQLSRIRDRFAWVSQSATLWVQTEMNNMADDEEHSSVLQYYRTYCEQEPERLPYNEVLRVLEAHPTSSKKSISMHDPEVRVRGNKYIRILVLKALLGLCRTIADLEHLYRQYLPILANMLSYTERALLYRSFLPNFCRLSGPERARGILLDMKNSPIDFIEPDLGLVASAYARRGDVEHAMQILDYMENSKEVDPADPLDLEIPIIERHLIHPHPRTYAELIKGFVSSGKFQAAMEVERRLYKLESYIPGADKRVERTLQKARDLWFKG